MQRTDPATIGIVQRYNESFNQGEVDGVMTVMTGDRVVETPIPPPDQSRSQGQEAVPALWQDFLPVYVQHRVRHRRHVRQQRPVTGSVAIHPGRPRRPVEPSPQRRLSKVRNGKVAENLVYLKG